MDGVGDHMFVDPNQLMRGRELVRTLHDRLGDRMVDLVSDAEGWFELQTAVEDHETSAIRSVWREIDLLAQVREKGERILAIAIGTSDGQRGLVVVTDRRLVHIAIERMPPVRQVDRDRIRSVETTMGLLGSRLVITKKDGTVSSIDRLRPRTAAGSLEQLLAPIEDPTEG